MVKKGGLSWKGFYKNERSLQAQLIEDRLTFLMNNDDPEVLNVVERGGILSFPHTMLSGTLDPVIRTAKALLDSGKDHVIALAVLHYGNHGPSDEFSLDTFIHVFNKLKEDLGIDYPSLECLYPPSNRVPYKDEEDRMIRAQEEAECLRGRIDGSTAVVMTGDLCHYGQDYSITSSDPDIEGQTHRWIEKGMDVLYGEGDLMGFLDHSHKIGNDQRTVGIMARTILGNDLEYKFFQKKFVDYTEVLEKDTPHLVASYFYGVWKR